MSRIEEWAEKLAELAVFGANVQPGQLVAVTSHIGKEDVTRRIARAAYARAKQTDQSPLRSSWFPGYIAWLAVSRSDARRVEN